MHTCLEASTTAAKYLKAEIAEHTKQILFSITGLEFVCAMGNFPLKWYVAHHRLQIYQRKKCLKIISRREHFNTRLSIKMPAKSHCNYIGLFFDVHAEDSTGIQCLSRGFNKKQNAAKITLSEDRTRDFLGSSLMFYSLS